MDHAVSAVLGAVIFTAFVVGLADSIDAPPFYIIVAVVVGLMGYETYEVVRHGWKAFKFRRDSK